jgi:hypothetical protein
VEKASPIRVENESMRQIKNRLRRPFYMIANFLQALNGFCDVKINISILSNLNFFTKVEKHYHNPIIFQIDDEEKALRIAKECPNVHVEIQKTIEAQKEEIPNDI